MKLHEKTTDELTGSPGYSDLCSPELPAGKGFLLPHAVSIFPDNYPQAIKSCTWSLGTEQFNSQPGAWLINQLITHRQ